MKKRKIAVFTGNRAEYGLQLPILKVLQNHPQLDYSLIVSGAHLDPNFGKSLEEIRSDGFKIDTEVEIKLEKESRTMTAHAIGSGVLSISTALEKIMPDILVVYADRFEGFSAVIAGTQMNIPTAHIEGGDITEGGALDDSVRHAMTKLSHLHFTTNIQATNRILAMGEEPWRVHTVGFPAMDLISKGNYATEKEIIEKLNLKLSEPIVLFTQHSVTTEFEKVNQQIVPSIEALKILSQKGIQIVITYPNNDVGGRLIIDNINQINLNKFQNIKIVKSLGRYLYHGILALAKDLNKRIVCVGNSSSGIKETPIFGCPTVNIGSRQSGRLRGENVIDSDYDQNDITLGIEKSLYNDAFRLIAKNTSNPYYMGDAGEKIVEVLKNVELGEKLIRKGMTLKGFQEGGWFS